MRQREALDQFIRAGLKRMHIPGLAYGLARNGRIQVAKGFGYRDVLERLPVSPRSMFGIASMTKSFTAAAIMRLQEDGELRVTDPLVRHLPEFETPEPRWTRKIQLHHLLTHSAGLPPLPTIWYTFSRSVFRELPFDRATARSVGIDPQHLPIERVSQLLEFLRTTRYSPLGPVGAQFSYSNEGFALLGAVVERVSGGSYEGFVEEEILRPAGMRATTFDPGILLRSEDRVTLYSPNWARPRGRHPSVASEEWWETTSFRASGGLRSTVDDLLRYLEMYRTLGRVDGERILDRASIRTMMSPHVAATPGAQYGYGLAISGESSGTRVVHHSGGLKGVSSFMAVLPAKGLTAVALANADDVPSNHFALAGFNAMLGRPLPTPFDTPARPAGRPPLSDYAGLFGCGEGWWVRVRPQSRSLRLDFIGIEIAAKGVLLRPYGGDLFSVVRAGVPGYVRFLRGPHGIVDRVQLGSRLVRKRSAGDLRLARQGRLAW